MVAKGSTNRAESVLAPPSSRRFERHAYFDVGVLEQGIQENVQDKIVQDQDRETLVMLKTCGYAEGPTDKAVIGN